MQFEGHDAFDIAKLLPSEWVELVTVRQELELDKLANESCSPGLYVHGSAKVNSDCSASDDRKVFVTAKNIDEAEEAYNLFRLGKLKRKENWENQ